MAEMADLIFGVAFVGIGAWSVITSADDWAKLWGGLGACIAGLGLVGLVVIH